MPSLPLIVCEHCDSVYRRPSLGRGETARCERCGAMLERFGGLDPERLLALTFATAIVFVIANVYPVVRISMGGQTNDATFWDATIALAQGDAMPVAIVCALAMFFVPLAQIALLGWVLWYARSRRRAPGFAAAMRALGLLRPWSMIEVFLLGVLVSIVKLAGLLNVSAGVGAWAMAMLTLLITLIAGRNIRSLWSFTEPAR